MNQCLWNGISIENDSTSVQPWNVRLNYTKHYFLLKFASIQREQKHSHRLRKTIEILLKIKFIYSAAILTFHFINDGNIKSK